MLFVPPYSRKNWKQSSPLWNTFLGTKSTYYMCCLFNTQSFHLDMSWFSISNFCLFNPCIIFSSLCDVSQYERRSMIAFFFCCYETISMNVVVLKKQHKFISSQFCSVLLKCNMAQLGSLCMISPGWNQGVYKAPGKKSLSGLFRLLSGSSSLWLWDWGLISLLTVGQRLLSASKDHLYF